MNDLGSDFSKSYLIYIEECLGTFYSKHPSGPHLPLCRGRGAVALPLLDISHRNTQTKFGWNNLDLYNFLTKMNTASDNKYL